MVAHFAQTAHAQAKNLASLNTELVHAYDATLAGWAQALELRDSETRDHTIRVTELTLALARRFSLPEESLSHIWRGALLHDIGKIGIPDSILLKPGPLNEEEWQVMRQHPVHAYNLLNAIGYLRPALDIPRYHHEKWDGSGYPEGLRGADIPFAARMFAIIDVWDALINDRPYRAAWPQERVTRYIRSLSGSHFDPEVVNVFLELVEAESTDGKLEAAVKN
jgi:putative nucleotidyltransferase with HDIG domain